uniref:ER membrane protein complex subunit 8 n=1 Tax=Eptatretus burgeri TaxID=7764 RepID=A0A8C4RCB7_EPTBU
MSIVKLTVQAYTKMVLHAAKYPHRAVCGLLLGDKRAPDLERVSLVDAVPLFHVALPLAPMLEVALTQLDIWCKEHDLVIAGYYQVNENQISIFRVIVLACCDHERVPWKCKLLSQNCHLCLVQTARGALIRSGAYLELSDFDNHLDDLRRDWANDHVNRMILDSC